MDKRPLLSGGKMPSISPPSLPTPPSPSPSPARTGDSSCSNRQESAPPPLRIGDGSCSERQESGEKRDAKNKAGDAKADTRRFFSIPSLLPFFKKADSTSSSSSGDKTAAGSSNHKTHNDAEFAGMIERLEDLSRSTGSSWRIADPLVRLATAVRSLATVERADPKATSAAQFEVLLAAAALTMAASGHKVNEVDGTTAKKLASEAAALAGKSGELSISGHRGHGQEGSYLYAISISGSLALLPYLPTQIPASLQPIVGGVFGAVFAAASVGAILTLTATKNSDVKAGGVLDKVSFAAFSLLVVAFAFSALASGNVVLMVVLMVICAMIMVMGHVYAWSR